MTNPGIGSLITGDKDKDAIHIAVAPMVAYEKLSPGDHVGFTLEGDFNHVSKDRHPIGIVDPFLREDVKPGERFWLFMYPDTITGLRHEWTHPAFTPQAAVDNRRYRKEAAKVWLEDFASAANLDFPQVIAAGHTYLSRGDIMVQHDEESARDALWDKGGPEKFWANWSDYTGEPVSHTTREDGIFSCSC